MRFCGNCGARLDEASEASSSASEAPEQLGVLMGADLFKRLQAAGVEAAGQRRNVTVLFADLTGYTALSGRIDSEDLFEIVQRYINLLIKSVYKYEGIIDKITGDGIMALFGAPISHENNAERAVRAALDMQADVAQLSRELYPTIDVELGMRVGLHSGLVVVGGVGSNLMMDYTAIGDTVNLAHRIEEAAPPGTILVSESVYRQTHKLFDCQQISVLNPKGISYPVPAFRVAGTRIQPGLLRGLEGLRAPLTGRDEELKRLGTIADELFKKELGQFVLITGEAGLGKSRLTAEFKTLLAPVNSAILEGQSLAYRRSVSYWMFLDVLYNYLGATPATPPAQIRERLIQLVYRALDTKAAEFLPFFEHLLSLPHSDPAQAEHLSYLDGGQLRQQTLLGVRNLLLAEARRQPLVLILEDLHWADEASLGLLRYLLETLPQAPIIIIGITRRIEDKSLVELVDWAKTHLRTHYHQIDLRSLSEDQSERLLVQLLEMPNIPHDIQAEILQRASGIPFYLEEILRMLIDAEAIQRVKGRWQLMPGANVGTMGVPENLEGLILARFDRLTSVERRILQIASVIGKKFSLSVLETVFDSTAPYNLVQELGILELREFILTLQGSPNPEYTFRHILMSDAIYSTLLRRESSRIHGQVAQAIETIYADRLESQVELLANHYRFSPALDRALHYLIIAGQKAARNNVNEQALQHFEAGIAILDKVTHQPTQAIALRMGLGDVLVFFGDYTAARNHYQAALQVISGQEKPYAYLEDQCALYRKIAKTQERQGEYDRSIADLKLAETVLQSAGRDLPVERARILNDIAWIHFRLGNISEAKQLLLESLELVENTDAYDAIASIFNRLGGIAYNQGDWDLAAGYLRKSIAIRESVHDVVGLATSFNNLGLLEVEMGALDNALENLSHSYELKKQLGQSEGIAMALNNLGWVRIQRGEIEEAHNALQAALELADKIGYASLHRQILKNIGELHLAAHNWQEAADTLQRTIPELIELSVPDQLLDTYRLLGEAALGSDDLNSAIEWNLKAEKLIATLAEKYEELPSIQRGEWQRYQGMLNIKLGNWEEAQRYLKESEVTFQGLRSRIYMGRVAYQMGILAQVQGDWRAAQLKYREAALQFQSVGARLYEKRANEARLSHR